MRRYSTYKRLALSPHINIRLYIFIRIYMTRGESGDTHNATEHESQLKLTSHKFTKSSTAHFFLPKGETGDHTV